MKRKVHFIKRADDPWELSLPVCGHYGPDQTYDVSAVTCKRCLKKLNTYKLGGAPELERIYPYPGNPFCLSEYWETPESSFIPDTTASGKERGVRELDNWIMSYLKLVEETEPPQRYHLWSAITLIAAMLGRKCTVKLGPETLFPNLYTVLIGPPGVRKGTAIKYCTDIMSELEDITTAPDAITKEALCMEMENRRAVENINGEPFVHCSLFVVAPELIVFIKENDHERLGYLCQLYDGLPKFEYKTKTSQNQYIVNPGLWLLSATTPNWIEIAMKQLGVGGGMTSRTIFVYAGQKGAHIPITRMKPFDPQLRAKLVTDLAEIRSLKGNFFVTKDADNLYAKWYEGKYKETGVDDARFASYWERLPSMVIKVAMVMSASRREDMTVTENDIANSIKMFEKIHPEMPQSFGGLGYNVLGSQTEMVRNLLRDKRRCTKSYIMHTLRHNISAWDYERIRQGLLAEHFCMVDAAGFKELGEEMLVCLEPQTKDNVDME